MLTGVVVLNVTVVALGVLAYRLARCCRGRWGRSTLADRAATAAAWMVGPLLLVGSGLAEALAARWPTFLAAIFIAAVAWRIGRLRADLRKASQAARLLALMLGVVLPSLAFYPTLVDAADARAAHAGRDAPTRRRCSTSGGLLQARLAGTLADIDRVPGLEDLVRAAGPEPEGAPPVDAAFLIWSQTELSRLRLTSSIELFDAAGALVSRFSLKLPDVGGAQAAEPKVGVSGTSSRKSRRSSPRSGGCCTRAAGSAARTSTDAVDESARWSCTSCSTTATCRSSPRRARTSRCSDPGAPLAAVPPRPMPVSFSVYGWSGKVLYTSESRARANRRGGVRSSGGQPRALLGSAHRTTGAIDAYVLNDRGAIYVLSTRSVRAAWPPHRDGRAGGARLRSCSSARLPPAFVYGRVAARTPTSGRALLREVRASFYRKLFLAFVAAAVVPVVALAFVARAYFASLLFADIEMEATRTATAASRVVEDFGSLQVRGLAAFPNIDDNIVVWLSRVIAQDVNVFDGADLLASSERNLFASGLLTHSHARAKRIAPSCSKGSRRSSDASRSGRLSISWPRRRCGSNRATPSSWCRSPPGSRKSRVRSKSWIGASCWPLCCSS